MLRKPIPGFTDTELWVVRETLKERYGQEIPLEVVSSDIRLDPADRDVTPCPALFWRERGANFVIFKTGTDRYRNQFYYRGFEQYGTGKFEFDNIGDCVVTLLQVQADHDRARAQRTEKGPAQADQPAKPATDKKDSDEEWYYQPVIWE
jgi:hypothetical protein